MKRRLIAGTGAIIIVLVAALAVVGGNSAAKEVSVADAAGMAGSGKKVQVTGNVVENSFSISDNELSFAIYDPEADPAKTVQLIVRYDGGVSATFGNDVTAICTGRMSEEGVLMCTELVTKCPSKYEDATDALSITRLLAYGDSVLNKPVKIVGTVKDGSLAGVDADERFILFDPEDGAELSIRYTGALPDEVSEGTVVVLTGSIGADGAFTATDVALEA